MQTEFRMHLPIQDPNLFTIELEALPGVMRFQGSSYNQVWLGIGLNLELTGDYYGCLATFQITQTPILWVHSLGRTSKFSSVWSILGWWRELEEKFM